MNNKNKEGGQKKDERPKERGWDAMQPNRKIGEKKDEMGRPLGKNGCKQTSKESRGGKKSGSTIFYLTLTPVQQGTRRKNTADT